MVRSLVVLCCLERCWLVAEMGILDVVDVLRRVLLRRRDIAEFPSLTSAIFLYFLLVPVDCVGSVSLVCPRG